MNNFSLKLIDKIGHTALSLEYFTFAGNELWNKSEKELLDIGKKELEKTGLAKACDIIDGMIMKIPQAYPVYEKNYKKHLSIIMDYLSGFSNLHLMGRNGLHQYNNMDIAMISAMSAVNKIQLDEKVISRQESSSTKHAAV